jgi:hypothetical protein
MNPTFLVKKDKYQILKMGKNHYKTIFIVENRDLIMEKIIGFNLLQLMYQVNSQNYEKIKIDILNTTHADLYLLVKPIFKEFGISQRYGAFSIKRIDYPETNTSVFQGLRNNELIEKYHNKSLKAEPLGMHTILMECKLLGPHKMLVSQDMYFDDSNINNLLVEKAFTMFIKDNLKKVIAFVEAIH